MLIETVPLGSNLPVADIGLYRLDLFRHCKDLKFAFLLYLMYIFFLLLTNLYFNLFLISLLVCYICVELSRSLRSPPVCAQASCVEFALLTSFYELKFIAFP